MKAFVVYESMFGNTKLVAEAIGEGLTETMDTAVVEVGDASPRIGEDVSLLVIGGPTHAFGMTRPQTREDAGRQATNPLVSQGDGIREWLDRLAGARPPCATFDTRIAKPKLPGSAAKKAMKHLRHRGFHEIAPPASFYVDGSDGPLVEGEAERALAWGIDLAKRIQAVASLS